MLLLSWRLWLAVGLAAALTFSHAVAYRHGKAAVRAEWDSAVAAQLQAAAAVEQENRRIESSRQSRVIEAQNETVKRNASIEVDHAAAGAERSRLLQRAHIATSCTNVPSDPKAPGDRPTATNDAVLAACTAEVQELGRIADRHASDVRLLLESWPR